MHRKGLNDTSEKLELEDWNHISSDQLAREKAGQIPNRFFGAVDVNAATCKPPIPYLKEIHAIVFRGRCIRDEGGLQAIFSNEAPT